MGRRGGSCGPGICRKVWTCCFGMTWGLLIVGLLLCHIAISKLIPPMKALPDNLTKGFYTAFGFESLEADAKNIKDACYAAITNSGPNGCGLAAPTAATNCNNYNQNNAAGNSMKDTTAHKTAILDAFANSLAKIEKVGNDKYFGMEQLKKTAEDLGKITDKVESLVTKDPGVTASQQERFKARCRVQAVGYCEMWKNSDKIGDGAGTAKSEIDKMINNEMVQQYQDNTDKAKLAHALPYILLVAMVFFALFWYKDAACCCCGGSCVGMIFMSFFVIFWLVCFIISTILAAVGLAVEHGADKIPIPGDVFKGNPTLGDILDHIRATYPEFWMIVFDPLEKPCKLFANSAVIFALFCLIIGIYGLCLCILRPYTDKDDGKSGSGGPAPQTVGAKS